MVFHEPASALATRGACVTPPAGLLHLHRRTLVNVLILGGTAEARRDVAWVFHRESRLCRGHLVQVDGERDQPRLIAALEAWTFASRPACRPDPLRAAETGTLFLDSVERLTPRAQELLLAFASRRGSWWEDDETPWVGRLVVGGGSGLVEAVTQGRFSAGLFDLLDKVRIELPAGLRGAA